MGRAEPSGARGQEANRCGESGGGRESRRHESIGQRGTPRSRRLWALELEERNRLLIEGRALKASDHLALHGGE